MMTSRERILRSLRCEPVDRVPVCLFLADQGHFINQICPDVDPWDFETLQLKIIEFQKSMGFDILMRVLYMDPQKLPYIIISKLSELTSRPYLNMKKIRSARE